MNEFKACKKTVTVGKIEQHYNEGAGIVDYLACSPERRDDMFSGQLIGLIECILHQSIANNEHLNQHRIPLSSLGIAKLECSGPTFSTHFQLDLIPEE